MQALCSITAAVLILDVGMLAFLFLALVSSSYFYYIIFV